MRVERRHTAQSLACRHTPIIRRAPAHSSKRRVPAYTDHTSSAGTQLKASRAIRVDASRERRTCPGTREPSRAHSAGNVRRAERDGSTAQIRRVENLEIIENPRMATLTNPQRPI